MSEVKQAIAIVKEKLSRADKNNLGYHRFSIAEMEAIWGVLAKSASEFAEIEAQRDALAALTAPPVKLPDRYDIGSMIDVEKDDDGPLYLREDVIGAIRAAGYQVEGE